MTYDNTIKTEFSDIYALLLEITNAIKGVVYTYTKEDDFVKVRDIAEMQIIYWIEIVQRMHACGVSSLQRLSKWIEAMDISWKHYNYYGYCSSLRGLIESCSDTFYTSGKVCYTVADHFAIIEKALKGEATKVRLSEELENALIHFIFARHLSATEKVTEPKSHKALHVADYLKSLESAAINELYSELCQVSHPSMVSLQPFLMSTPEHPLILHMKNIDKELNQDLLDRYRSSILEALKIAIAPSICLLKMINRFDSSVTETLRVDTKVVQFMDDHLYWKTVVDKIEKSYSEL